MTEEEDLEFKRLDTDAANAFLEALAAGDSPTAASRKGRPDLPGTKARAWFYYHRDRDDKFRAAWEDAKEQGLDLLEDEARRRAVEGVKTPIFGPADKETGERPIIGHKIDYSDTLLVTLLKAGRPHKFRESFKHEVELDGKGLGDKAATAMETLSQAILAIHKAKAAEAKEKGTEAP